MLLRLTSNVLKVDMIKHVFPEFSAIARNRGESTAILHCHSIVCLIKTMPEGTIMTLTLKNHLAPRNQESPRKASEAFVHVPLPGSITCT